MRSLLSLTILCLSGGAALAQEETVVETTSRSERFFGLGAGTTLAGVRGGELEFHLHDVVIEAVIGFSSVSPSSGPSQTVLAFAAGVFYKLKLHDRVGLWLGARAEVGYLDGGSSSYTEGGFYGGGNSTTEIVLEAPLRVQVEIADRVAVHAEVGPVLDVVGDGGGILPVSSGLMHGVYLSAGRTALLGTIGFTFYLR